MPASGLYLWYTDSSISDIPGIAGTFVGHRHHVEMLEWTAFFLYVFSVWIGFSAPSRRIRSGPHLLFESFCYCLLHLWNFDGFFPCLCPCPWSWFVDLLETACVLRVSEGLETVVHMYLDIYDFVSCVN